jgi:uncharacterized protein (DUF2147 family)
MKFLRSTVVVAALVTLASSLPASASTAPSLNVAKQAALPTGANGVPQGYLPALTCVSPGNCEAAGAYTSAKGDVEGLILNESKGVWTAPMSLTVPPGAALDPGVTIYGLSCGTLGNCAAVGSYEDASGNIEAFIANEVNAKWSSAKEVTLPTGALGVGQNALVRSIDCTSAGNCSAVGNYQDNNSLTPRSQSFVADEVNGTWHHSIEVTTAAAANFDPFITLNQISCASSTNCVAVGSFIDSNDVTQGLIVNEIKGAWSKGVALSLPSSASAYAGASLSEVDCVRDSNCTVVGTFSTTSGAVQGLSAHGAHGAWSRAKELTMPGNANTNPHVFLYGYDGISCATATSCSIGGQYQDSAGNDQGFLENEVAGRWTSAVTLSLPPGATEAGANGGVIAVTCPSSNNCRAGAAYLDSAGNYQALIASDVNGRWRTGVKVTLPSRATTVGVDGGLYSLICVTRSSCTGTGSYEKNSLTYEGFTLAS